MCKITLRKVASGNLNVHVISQKENSMLLNRVCGLNNVICIIEKNSF